MCLLLTEHVENKTKKEKEGTPKRDFSYTSKFHGGWTSVLSTRQFASRMDGSGGMMRSSSVLMLTVDERRP